MCKNQPLRMKSKFLFNIFFCHTMTPWTPCRVQPSLNRCQPPKVESGENLKKVTYQCWLNTKTCDIMASHSSSVFGQRSPEAPPPLFPISVHNGNVEILCRWQHQLSANTCYCMVKTKGYLLSLRLCQIGSTSPASPPLFTMAHRGDESWNAIKFWSALIAKCLQTPWLQQSGSWDVFFVLFMKENKLH